MKILHLLAQKPDSTGSGIYLRETVASLARAGHEQAVIAGIAPEDEPELAEGVAFRPVRFETPDLPFPVVGMSNVMPYRATRYMDLTPAMVRQFKTAFIRAIDEVLDRFTPELVICHHLYLLCGVAVDHIRARMQADPALAGCVLCGLSHSTDIRQMRQIPLERDFIRRGVRGLDRVYALHEEQAREIEEVYGVEAGRIRVVGTGYDSTTFREQPAMREPEAAELVYVGKICRKKGVESLLKALEALDGRVPGIHLTLVGGYSDEREYREIVDYAQSRKLPVAFAGRVSQDDLVAAYSASNVFVLPSFYEGLPLVVVEALACGCKVVATDLPGLGPWLAANVRGGHVELVEPPRMRDVDTPLDEDLPAFEARLATALERVIAAPAAPCDTSRVSWDALAGRLL